MSAPCLHARGCPCPWPGCWNGPAGARVVVCGIEGAKYFDRGFVLAGRELVVGWVEVEPFEVEGHEVHVREVACVR